MSNSVASSTSPIRLPTGRTLPAGGRCYARLLCLTMTSIKQEIFSNLQQPFLRALAFQLIRNEDMQGLS